MMGYIIPIPDIGIFHEIQNPKYFGTHGMPDYASEPGPENIIRVTQG